MASPDGARDGIGGRRGLRGRSDALYRLDVCESGAPPEFDPEWRAAIKKELDEEWTKPARDARVTCRTVMEYGRPASVITRVADEVNADVIVVGRRGRGGVSELLLGSVSHEVVLQSKRPVLVVSEPPPA